MKKISFILMALAMVMGMTQCKKENNENGNFTPLEGEEVNITLVLGGGSSSDSKVDVNLGFTPATEAPVRFEKDDVIWVAYDGRCVGSLIYDDELSSSAVDQNGDQLGVFKGMVTINELVNPTPLYFYFLGNKTPYNIDNPTSTTWQAVGASQLTVDLSDQSSELPVISYAMSEQNYSSDVHSYTVKYGWLKNQCALVKFTMENIYDKGTAMSSTNDLDQNSNAIYTTPKPITIYGMDNQVTINLTNPAGNAEALWGPDVEHIIHELDASFVWSKKDGESGDNIIKLYQPSETEEVVRYAIVAPKTGENTNYNTPIGKLDVPFDASSDPYGFFGTYRLVGDVANNAYYQDAKIDLVWHSGAFTVSDNSGTTTYQVVFSRGNAQYNCGSGEWRFAKHQQDFVGGGLLRNNSGGYVGTVVLDENDDTSPALNSDGEGANMSDNEKIVTDGYEGWIDLYGWGTGNRPQVVTNASTAASGAPYNIAKFVDWGQNAFGNSGKPTSNTWWRSLTKDEWVWLIEDRGGETNATDKNGLGKVNGVKGLILLPDNWGGMPEGVNITWKPSKEHNSTIHYHVDGSPNINWGNMSFSESDWQKMEQAGAVFLPAAGYRGHTIDTDNVNDEFDGGSGSGGANLDHGAYWTRTPCDENVSSYVLRFGNASYYANHPSLWVNPAQYMDPANGHAVRLVHRL